MNAAYCSLVNNGSGRSRRNCFNAPATLLTSWKKCSGLRKSTVAASVYIPLNQRAGAQALEAVGLDGREAFTRRRAVDGEGQAEVRFVGGGL